MNENLETKLLKGNLKFRWKVIHDLEKIDVTEDLPKYPVLFLTCMDPRIDIHRIFQLNPGDVFVLRNAGNSFTIDMLRSILIAVHEYHIKYIIILGHLDCGMTKINVIELREKIYAKSRELIFHNKNNPYTELRNFFKPFKDVLKNINEQVETLRDFKGFPMDVEILGWLYDVHTGWVFETNKSSDFESIEDFMKAYEELIVKKDLELVDSLDSLEEGPLAPKNLNYEEGLPVMNRESLKEKEYSHGVKSEYIKHDPQINNNNIEIDLSLNPPRITIPKIYIPEIKVNVPNMYKNKKERD
ncbi:MAG: carbonic anhydrase [Promethearchaeota archaeon]